MKYIGISAIFQYIPRTLTINDGDLIEWAVQCLDKIGLSFNYEKVTEIFEVIDHKFNLPSDFIKIANLAWIDQLPLSQANEAAIAVERSDLENDLLRIQHQGVTYLFNYFNYTNSIHDKKTFVPMKLRNLPFASKFHCNDCPNLYQECEEYYDVTPFNQIQTSKKSGYVCLEYLRYAQEHGEYLIPDDVELLEAIAAYVMYRQWEQRWAEMEQGAESRMSFYLNRFQILAKKVKGSFVVRGADLTSLLDITQRDYNKIVKNG